MKKGPAASSPEEYVSALDGWRRKCVEQLRVAVRGAARLEEMIKWGNLVYFAGGPILLIRAEDERVLFGFWRGQRLRTIEPRLKPGGKYEMATLELRAGNAIAEDTIQKLTRKAVRLNKELGDPTLEARKTKA